MSAEYNIAKHIVIIGALHTSWSSYTICTFFAYSLGVDVGTTWMMRLDCSRDGIHRYSFIKLAIFLERSCKRFSNRCNMVLLLMQTHSCWHPWRSRGSLLHCSVRRLWRQHRPWGRIHLHRRRFKSDVNKFLNLRQFLSPCATCERDIASLLWACQYICMCVCMCVLFSYRQDLKKKHRTNAYQILYTSLAW